MNVRSLVAPLLLLAVSSSACQTPGAPTTEGSVERSQDSPVIVTAALVAISADLLQRAYDAGFTWAQEVVMEKLFSSKTPLGNESQAAAEQVARSAGLSLRDELQRRVKTDLNALHESLTNDYIPGLPESTTQLALMIEKANEIKNALESYGLDDGDTDRIEAALTHYQSYLLVVSIKLVLQRERLRLAKAATPPSPDAITQLQASMAATAARSYRYLEDLRTSRLEKFLKRKRLSFAYQESAEREVFDTKQNLRYKYCATPEGKSPECGDPSKTVCPNELDLACIERAQAEAKASFDDKKIEAKIVDDYRKAIFAPDLDKVLAQLQSLSRL